MEVSFAGVAGGVVLLIAVYTIYLNVMASIVIRYSFWLSRFRRVPQSVFVWCAPLLGAGLVLHLLYLDAPNVLPKTWIPWPFKKMIHGKPIKPNKNRRNLRVPSSGGR